MSKILLYSESYTPKKFETFTEAFVDLSSNGFIIQSLNDGLITTNLGIIEFSKLDIENSKTNFIEDISDYRDDLRASFAMLQKQGIPMPEETVAALRGQLAFMNTPKEDSISEVNINNEESSSEVDKDKEEVLVEKPKTKVKKTKEVKSTELEDSDNKEMPEGIMD